MDERRTDTRDRIRDIALDLFTNRGYDGTSLREIAERIGVTKSAVYYHFRTKEEILDSLVEDFLSRVDNVVEAVGPPAAKSREQVLCRYADLLTGRTGRLARLLQDDRTSTRDLVADAEIRARFDRLVTALTATPAVCSRSVA